MIIFDRAEGSIAVLEEDGEMKNVSRELVAENACAGDVLVLIDGIYVPDKEATEHRREQLRNKFSRLRRKRNDG
ncbi:MAG: DUF3006 domain-containing protein [Ruminococcus sp.]|nr:DUF3006 domain-containing protein [Ruminococcus sp.]